MEQPTPPADPGPPAEASTEQFVVAPPGIASLLEQRDSLLAFVEAISSELELRPLLTRILIYACELIGADRGSIGLVGARGDTVRTEAAYNMPPEELGSEMPRGRGLGGRVLEEGAPVILNSYAETGVRPGWGEMLRDRVIGVPIEWQGEITGFIGLGFQPRAGERRAVAPEDVEALRVFARHAAVAIANARRYKRERRRTERLELIARVGRMVTAQRRVEELLQAACDAIHEVLGYPNVAIPLVEGDPDVLVSRVHAGRQGSILEAGGEATRPLEAAGFALEWPQEHEDASPFILRIPVGAGIIGSAARTREVQLVHDVRSDPRYVPTPGLPDVVAELAVPMVLGDRLLGVLNVESDEPLTEEDVGGLGIVADQLAVAIENARLWERAQAAAVLEERQRLARELHDSVTQHLFGLTLLAQTLGEAARRDPDEAERRADTILEQSRLALMEMRALLEELRPAGGSTAPPAPTHDTLPPQVTTAAARLRERGLPAVLRAWLDEAVLDGLAVELDTAAYTAQAGHREAALLRIVQEAVHNAVKHAGAGRARVRIRATRAGALRLSVADDGAGMDRDSGNGFGLRNMRERAAEEGGTLRVRSAAGRGTVVHVRIPVKATQP